MSIEFTNRMIKHFDEKASRYNESWYKDETYYGYYFKKLRKAYGDLHGKRILDIGCGTGIHMSHLKLGGADVFGVDFSPSMLKVAKSNLDVEFARVECSKIPFRESTFDYAVSVNLFQHLSTDDARVGFIKEVRRVLKEGGRFILETNNLGKRYRATTGSTQREFSGSKHYVRYYDIDELKGFLASAGMKVVKVQGIKHIHYGLGNRLGAKLSSRLAVGLEFLLSGVKWLDRKAPFVWVIGER